MLSSSISSIMTVMPLYLVVLQVEECSRAVGITQRELLRTWRGRTHTLQWQSSRKMQLRSTFRFGTTVTIIWNACIDGDIITSDIMSPVSSAGLLRYSLDSWSCSSLFLCILLLDLHPFVESDLQRVTAQHPDHLGYKTHAKNIKTQHLHGHHKLSSSHSRY